MELVFCDKLGWNVLLVVYTTEFCLLVMYFVILRFCLVKLSCKGLVCLLRGLPVVDFSEL